MTIAVALRGDFKASQLRGLARKRRMVRRLDGFWLLQRSMTVRRAPRRRRSVASDFFPSRRKSIRTGLAEIFNRRRHRLRDLFPRPYQAGYGFQLEMS